MKAGGANFLSYLSVGGAYFLRNYSLRILAHTQHLRKRSESPEVEESAGVAHTFFEGVIFGPRFFRGRGILEQELARRPDKPTGVLLRGSAHVKL